MAYKKRNDGRKFEECRPIEAKAGIIKNATGSAMFRIGKTVAYAAVYGPREMFPRFMKDPTKGVLRCHYTMMPFSGMGERIRPGQNRRAKEISLVTKQALAEVVDLSEFPNAAIDVFVEVPEADAGTRCAGISAAAIALADAGIPMKEMISAVAVGRVSDSLAVDLDYSEEAHEEGAADIPVAFTSRGGKVSLLQMDGDLTREQLKSALEMGKKACEDIYKVQVAAIKARYEVKNDK